MKKYIIYIGILAIGLALGWVLFGTSNSSTATQEHNHELAETENQQWTCSMHPQIMQNEAGSCPICGMDLIPVESSSEGLTANQFNMTKNAMALANIETTIIKKSTGISNRLTLSGKVKENEKNTAVQTAHFGGRIEKLYINSTGEKVRKGQLLALIYSPELVTAQKELLTALSMKDSQPNLYKAVKNKLKLWKLSENQIQKIENSKEVIPNFPVYANVSGIVTMKMVEEGNHIMEGSPLLKIANLSTVWAEFDAYEKQLSSIKIGDEISITSNANPTKKIKAAVSFIDPVLNTATRTVIIRAELNNKNGNLKPGMFVQGELTIQMSNNTSLTVPKTAVLWTGKRSIVYVKQLGEEPIFEMREVVLGSTIGTNYEVLDGLKELEEVVTNGTFTVDAAAQLQGKKSMMNKTGGKVTTGHENHIGMQESDNIQEAEIKLERVPVSKKFQEQLHEVFNSYILLKNALVNDNSSTAQIAAKNLNEQLNKVDMKLLTDAKSHNLWMPLLKNILNSSKEIMNSNAIKIQREQFIVVSNNVSKSVEVFGINQTVYKQFCPMADNDKGAIWLSTEKHINNPYFGEMMLKCGNVESIIE